MNFEAIEIEYDTRGGSHFDAKKNLKPRTHLQPFNGEVHSGSDDAGNYSVAPRTVRRHSVSLDHGGCEAGKPASEQSV